MELKSYHPISLLPLVSKITERVIQNQVLRYMNDTKQLNKNLHAYRNLYSTTTAALQLTDFTCESADKGMIAQALLLDQSAAFDCVNAAILDSKLDLYGFTEESRRWFRSYMDKRSQYVVIGATRSRIRNVDSGVPQGSVLGPLLYLIFTNELPENMKENDCLELCHNNHDDLFGKNCDRCGQMPCFADDSTMVVAGKTTDQNIEVIRRKMEKVTDFLQSNQLVINEDKTKAQNFMVKQKRSKIPPDPPILEVPTPAGRKLIENQVHTRLLGINLHQDLGWRSHFYLGKRPLIPALRQRLGALRHLGSIIPRKGRQVLANGLIISKLTYMISVWGGAQTTHLNKLQCLLNKTARYVINGGRRWKTTRLMKECNWMTVRELSLFQSLITLWKIVHHGTPSQLAEKFHLNEDWEIVTSEPRLKTTADYWHWRSSRRWNELELDTRQATKISTFKTRLRKQIMDRRGTVT